MLIIRDCIFYQMLLKIAMGIVVRTIFFAVFGFVALLLAGIKVVANFLQSIRDNLRHSLTVLTKSDMDWFWAILENAKCDREVLYIILHNQRRQDVIRFRRCFTYLAGALRRYPYISAQKEEEVDDICRWVVSQGRGLYLTVLDNPEMMPHSVAGLTDKILYGVADRLFHKKYNKPISI